MRKVNFDNKLTSFKNRIASNNTKHLEVQKKLNSLIREGYNFSLGRIYSTMNGGSKNTFFHLPTLDTLDLKKIDLLKDTEYVPSWKSKGVYNIKVKPLYIVFLHSMKLSGYKRGIETEKDSLPVQQNIY